MQGTITQLKTCTAELINFGKRTSIPILLIGHINKDGNIAGPKVLEHMVDTVLQFEGDPHKTGYLEYLNTNKTKIIQIDFAYILKFIT